MKRTYLSLAFVGLCAALAPGAQATTFETFTTYYTAFHFSSVAWNKEVTGVYAHVGVKTRTSEFRGNYEFWDGVQHVELKRQGDHFFAKAILHGSAGYEYQTELGAIVQYWVYFADGTSLMTEATMIPSTRFAHEPSDDDAACKADNAEQVKAFDATGDAGSTSALELNCTYTG